MGPLPLERTVPAAQFRDNVTARELVVSPEVRTQLKRVLLVPTRYGAMKILIAVFLLAGLLGLAQEAAFQWVTRTLERGSINFPLALAPVTDAGAPTNLIGWGLMLNDQAMPVSQWLMAQVVLLSLAILAGRLLWWSPVVMAAGGVANLIELGLRGAVLDWIIFPMGSTIKAISLGDLAILLGSAWCVLAVCVICIRAVPEIFRGQRGRGTGSELS